MKINKTRIGLSPRTSPLFPENRCSINQSPSGLRGGQISPFDQSTQSQSERECLSGDGERQSKRDRRKFLINPLSLAHTQKKVLHLCLSFTLFFLLQSHKQREREKIDSLSRSDRFRYIFFPSFPISVKLTAQSRRSERAIRILDPLGKLPFALIDRFAIFPGRFRSSIKAMYFRTAVVSETKNNHSNGL